MEEKTIEIDEFEHGIPPPTKAAIAFFGGLIGTILIAWITGGLLGSFFGSLQKTLLYNLIPFVLAIALLSYLIYKAHIIGIHGLQFLVTFVLAIALSELFKIFAGKTLQQTAPFRRGGDLFSTLNDIMMPVAVLAIYLHIELTENDVPNPFRSIGIFTSGLPLVFGGLLQIIIGNTEFLQMLLNNPSLEKEIEDVLTFYLYIFGLIVLWISVYGLRVMYRTMVHADTPSVSQGSQLMMAGFSSLIGNFVLLGVRDTLSLNAILGNKDGINFTIHTSWLLMGSVFIIFMAYFLSPNFAYSVPFDVYQLLVINREDGVTLYSHVNEVRHYNKPAIQIALKSPAIVAIQTLLKEITFAEGTVQLIGMSDRNLLLQSEGPISSVLIATKSSYFLNKGLEEFTKAFYEQFKDSIYNFTGNVSTFKPAAELLLRYFPFFRAESL